jgi:isopentenyl-diphosphate delta-isomerase
MNYVVLVDNNDNEIGVEEKFLVHVQPLKLHRAFSIFILNDSGQLLIQKRGHQKKTWPKFWSNSCCSHPGPKEPTLLAAKRRLAEELGFTCDLEFLFKFQYEAKYNQYWGERELDHVLLGYYNDSVRPNPMEVDDFKFVDLDKLRIDMDENPARYTPWFRICFGDFMKSLAVE